MSRILVLSVLAIFAVPVCAQGESILSPGPSSKTIKSVPIYDSATAKTFAQSFALTGKASALRTMDFGILPTPRYVVQMLVQDGAAYDAGGACTNGVPNVNNALKALDSQKLVVVRLNFLHNVSGFQSRTAFSDSFEVNSVDQTAPAIAQFLSLVGVDVVSGTAWTIAIERKVDGNDVLAFEDAKGIVSKIVESNLMRRILSSWAGRLPPLDSQPEFLENFLCGI